VIDVTTSSWHKGIWFSLGDHTSGDTAAALKAVGKNQSLASVMLEFRRSITSENDSALQGAGN